MIFCNKIYIGKKFKEYRKLAGYTQEILAEKIGISEKHYGKIERGIFTPSLETFFQITDILNIPITEFYTKECYNSNKIELIKKLMTLNDKELELILKTAYTFKDFYTK